MALPMLSCCQVTRRDFVNSSMIALGGAVLGLQRQVAAQEDLASAGLAAPRLIDDLVAANHILADQGVLDGYGHISVRHDRDPNRYLLSRSVAAELVTADDIMEFDLDSNPVDARGRVSNIEAFIHGEIYKARPDVKAVVHNHSPELIPFGVSKVPLKPLYAMSSFIGEAVPIFDIRKTAGMTDMLVRSPALGHALALTLGNQAAVLMRGHGAVVVGPTLARVVARTIYLELNAKLQARAISLGGKITYLDPAEARRVETDVWNKEGFVRAWELWRRKVLNR